MRDRQNGAVGKTRADRLLDCEAETERLDGSASKGALREQHNDHGRHRTSKPETASWLTDGVGLVVDRGRRLVQNDDSRPAQQRARNAHQLPLPVAVVVAVLSNLMHESANQQTTLRNPHAA